LIEQNRIGLSQNLQPRSGDWPETADGQAGPRERVPPDRFLRQAELEAEAADFVLEQIPQRLDQLEAELGRQAADVVVRLDRRRRAVDGGAAFDDIRVQRALGEEAYILNSFRLILEHIDEDVADSLAFFLRVGDS